MRSLISLPRAVIVLSLVSLLNDAASEMITPLLPVFLTLTLGAGPAVVGLVEGIAEATASVLKLVSGRLADRGWNSKGLVLAGYGTSNLARPLIGLALGWPFVMALRFLDRLGKGLRTAPRDAIIAGAVDTGQRGRAFGFNRAMDHFGAVLGPLLAFAALSRDIPLGQVFVYSAVPGVLVILLLVFGLPSKGLSPAVAEPAPLRWQGLDTRLRALIVASGALALATTPEAFLVLWATTRGLDIALVPLIWAATSAVKMAVVYLAGGWSDRLGRLPVMLTGWALRVALLLTVTFAPMGSPTTWALFLAYGGSLALTEAAERSLVGDVARPDQRATAFGLYHLVCGLFALPGAVIFGLLWQWLGQAVAFSTAAALTAAAAAVLALIARAKS